MNNIFLRLLLTLRHYFTFWHLKRAAIYIIVDVLLLSLVRRGTSDTVLILKFDQLGDYIISRNFLVRVRHYGPYKSKRIIICANISLKDFIEKYDADAFDGYIWIDRTKLLNEMWARFVILRQVKMMGAQVEIQCMYGLES